MSDVPTVTALIVAAGSGSRMGGGGLPKQYRLLAGKSVLAHAVDALAAHPRIDAVRVVIGAGQGKLAMAALGGADAPLLALALAFILVVALLTAMPPPALRLHLRPPQRGPPLHA